jgi:ubiquinone/menaquinone biosynthesis C-methylase UbiE
MMAMAERKQYMRDVYSKHWIAAREEHYGFMEYDKNLCRYICERVKAGSRLLDVACGTGYPFADFLQQAGYSVYGLDIAPLLIEKCRQLYPEVKSEVGDVENMDYPDNKFDSTYCFHSSWYFPDLNKALDEMLRVTRPGGLVMLDINNRHNKSIDSTYRRAVFKNRRIPRYILNVARLILRRGVPNWNWNSIVHDVPTYPESIYEHLEKKGVSGFQVMVKAEDGSIKPAGSTGRLSDFARLVLVINK